MEEAAQERSTMPARERVALDHATVKLEIFGPHLPHPHQSDVRGGSGLRELRLRAGRSTWRALYRRVGDIFVILAVGREAQARPREFERMVMVATQRWGKQSNESE